MPGKVVIVTGISGSGSRLFCQKYRDRGKNVKIYHTGDMLYELAQNGQLPPIPMTNLLNVYPEKLADLRNRAFDMILQNLERDRQIYDIVFIDTHAVFFWNNVYENAYDWSYLNKINADMFITIIDKPSSIKENQLKTEHGRAQDHDYRDLLLWQNVEVNMTQGWASNYKKPIYIFSGKQDPEIIDSLFTNHFLIYSSFPMTDADPIATQKINNFKARLRSLRKEIDGRETPIIDPADIDIEIDSNMPHRIKETIDSQTVHRDLNWDVAQATHVVAYYPDDKASLSKGVSDECTKARQTGKFVFVICPRERISPFMEIAHKVFRDEEEFFNFFRPHVKESLEYYKRK